MVIIIIVVICDIVYDMVDVCVLLVRRRRLAATDLSMTIAKKAAKDTTIAVAGSTGYIGKFVTMECVRRGYNTLALTRNPASVIEGAEMVVTDVTDPASLEAAFAGRNVRLPHARRGILLRVIKGRRGLVDSCFVFFCVQSEM